MKRELRVFLFIALILWSLLLIGCQPGEVKKNPPLLEEGQVEGSAEDYKGENTREISDMAGRKLEVPKKINKLMSTDSVGAIIIYSLSPDKLVGWNYDLREEEKQYINEKYHDLPNLGGAGKSPLNLEELLKIDPDLLVSVGEIDQANIEKMDELSEKIGKPVLMLESDLNKLDESYEILGNILEEERAKELAQYCKDTMDDIKKNAEKIKEEDKKGLYYAEGPSGLETEPSNSWHSQVIDLLGARNVAQVEENKDKGKTEVNLEQIIDWNPEIIISWADERGGYYSGILKDPAWQDISAVKEDKVYEIPNRPFNWFDRPPSVNRVLGIRWLGNLIYPEIYNYNIKEEVRNFYKIFYHYELSDEEVEELIKNSI